MAGPWEKYSQTPQQTGSEAAKPWAKYGGTSEEKPVEKVQEPVGIARTAFDQSMQGATFGFADEASDRIGAAYAAAILPGDWKKNYKELLPQAREMTNEQLQAEFDQNPGTSIAAQFGGALLTGGASATTKTGASIVNSLRSGNTISRIGKGIAAGIASGGFAGAGSGQEDGRLKGAGIGAAIGGVGGAVIPAAVGVGGAVKDAVAPFYQGGRERIVGNFLNKQASNPAAVLASNTGEIIPGSIPTAGQATGDFGLLAVEKGLRNQAPEAFAIRASDNNAAKQKALEQIAGTPTDVKAAIAARASASSPLYEAAKSAQIKGDDDLASLMSRPSISKAWSRAKALAKEQGDPLTAGKDAPEHILETGLLDASGSPITKTIPSENMTYSGKGMHYLKMALDDLLDNPGQSSLAKNEYGAISQTKNDFLGWLENKVPEYNTARTEYAKLSKPINQMETLQEITGKIGLSAPDPRTGYDLISQPKLSRVFDSQKKDLAKNLTPQQFTTLEKVLKDLDRESASNSPLIRASGSDTVQNMAMSNLISGLVGDTVANSAIGKTATRPLGFAYKIPEEKIRELLLDTLMDPVKTKELMQRVAPKGGAKLTVRPSDRQLTRPIIGEAAK